jgi:hypothetical protein
VSLSSAEAEYMAVSTTAQEILWLRSLLGELGFPQATATVLLCDNQAAIAIASDDAHHARTKHIDIRHHFVRQHIAEGTLRMEWIASGEQEADILTKPLGRLQFAKLRDRVLTITKVKDARRCQMNTTTHEITTTRHHEITTTQRLDARPRHHGYGLAVREANTQTLTIHTHTHTTPIQHRHTHSHTHTQHPVSILSLHNASYRTLCMRCVRAVLTDQEATPKTKEEDEGRRRKVRARTEEHL